MTARPVRVSVSYRIPTMPPAYLANCLRDGDWNGAMEYLSGLSPVAVYTDWVDE